MVKKKVSVYKILVSAKKGAEKIGVKTGKRFSTYANKQAVNKKILRKGPRPVLDLRRRPEREVPIKQHGFKEGEIGHGNLL